MRIGAVSDTHGDLPDPIAWPTFDLFIHAGDAAPSPTNSDEDRRVQRAWIPEFARWLDRIRATTKVYVPGNHDLFMDGSDEPPALDAHVLTFDRLPGTRLFGCSWTRLDADVFPFPWSFGEPEAALSRRFEAIPDDTEILVSHAGIREVLDNAPGRLVGSEALATRARRLQSLRLVIHGHAHASGGKHAERDGVIWVNAARHVVTLEELSAPVVLERLDDPLGG